MLRYGCMLRYSRLWEVEWRPEGGGSIDISAPQHFRARSRSGRRRDRLYFVRGNHYSAAHAAWVPHAPRRPRALQSAPSPAARALGMSPVRLFARHCT
eukprot:2332571-Prymnesium_polylepis.1